MRSTVIAVLALAPLLAFAPGPAARATDDPLLIGTVGPGFTIDLTDASGKHVTELVAGHYEVLVHDLSAEHNFVLGSKTANARVFETEVPFVGDQTFTVDLPAGRYAYACSPHFQVMNGSFAVVPPTQPAPQLSTLSASVTPSTLRLSARSVAAGRYRISVRDASKTRNFHLLGPGVNRRTGKAFVGRTTWTVALTAGTYRFGSDPKLTGVLRVSV
jgi:plastocyanin